MTDREIALDYYARYVEYLDHWKNLKVISNQEKIDDYKYINQWVTEMEAEGGEE